MVVLIDDQSDGRSELLYVRRILTSQSGCFAVESK